MTRAPGDEEIAGGDNIHADKHVGFVVDIVGLHSLYSEGRYGGFDDDIKCIDGALFCCSEPPECGLPAWLQLKPPCEGCRDDGSGAPGIPNGDDAILILRAVIDSKNIGEDAIGFLCKGNAKSCL